MDGCSILIIDDDQDDIEILSQAFTSCGVETVHYVNSAMQAFIYLEKQTSKECLPKLIVTDLYLPGISGAEFLRDLKNMDAYKHIPVLVLSTIKNEQEIEKYRVLGEVDYLIKPSSYDEYKNIANYIKSKVVE